MNDYLIKERDKAAALRAAVEPIATALDWQVLPDLKNDDDYPCRFVRMESGNLEIMVEVPWNKPDRLEFTACRWPVYTDKDGKECRTSPHDLWNPQESSPTTTAANNRPAEVIAKQIRSKLLPEYQRIYDRLQQRADSSQAYANTEADCIKRLFEATQENPDTTRMNKPYFIRNLPGEMVCLDYRSPGDVKIGLSADEMIQVIGFLRQLRART